MYINDVAYVSIQGLEGPINHLAHGNSPVCFSKRAGRGGHGKKSPPDPADKRGTKNRSDSTDFILLGETREGGRDGWVDGGIGRKEGRKKDGGEKKKSHVTGKSRYISGSQ